MPHQPTASEIAHSQKVHLMFAGISERYDFLNHFLSLNVDKSWRRRVAANLQDILNNENAVVLDVACGTGDLTIELRKNAPAKIIGTDFCRPMLEIANSKSQISNLKIAYIEADAMNLSFADESFNAVTIAFGLRNLSNFEEGLRELHRVLKRGGRLVILEFSSVVVPGFRQLFQFYSAHILPRIGSVVSGSRSAYEYLPDSVSKFPDQKTLVKLMQKTGFDGVEYTNLTGGIAAIHIGKKAEPPA